MCRWRQFFAENLGSWLVEAGQSVTHYCLAARSRLLPFQREIPCSSLGGRIGRHLNWRARGLGMIEPLPWEYWFGLKPVLNDFDVFHFHDLYMAISPRTLQAVTRRKPVVLTVHDASAYTGGCLCPMDCRRFVGNCGDCPQTSEIGRMDFTRHNLKEMRRLARGRGVDYVFPSKWIQQQAGLSLKLDSAKDHHIPNGFDPRPYRFVSRQRARALLGIPPGQKVVAFSSARLDQKRKGTDFALAALRSVSALAPLALVIGGGGEAIKGALDGLACRTTGFVHDREQLGRFYAAADVVLYPSLADNLPITIQEAMAAATPVLAFEVGGVPELIRPNETGWLVPAGDQAALNRTLRQALESVETPAVGFRAQKFMAERFSAVQCAGCHVELYHAAVHRRDQTGVFS